MPPRNDSAGNLPIISRSAAREGFANALLLFVGNRNVRRRYTMAQLQTGIGCDDATLKAIERATYEADSDDYRNPPIDAIIGLCAFLGRAFVNEWLQLAGLGTFELMDGQIPLPKVLAAADAPENAADERRRLIQRLVELEGVL